MNPRSQTLIRIPASRKGRYTKSARDQGRTLADWAIRELDRASGYQSPDPSLLEELKGVAIELKCAGQALKSAAIQQKAENYLAIAAKRRNEQA